MAFSSRCLAKLVVLAMIFFGTAAPAKDIPCARAMEYLMPCRPFLTGNGEITSSCCMASQALAQATASQLTDRKSVYQCLEQFSVNINQKKVEQIPQLCNHQAPSSLPHKRFELNRYENLDIMAYRPTTPGNSPGIGHGGPPPHRRANSQGDVRSKSNRNKNPEIADSPPTTPGRSPGVGHDTPPHRAN